MPCETCSCQCVTILSSFAFSLRYITLDSILIIRWAPLIVMT